MKQQSFFILVGVLLMVLASVIGYAVMPPAPSTSAADTPIRATAGIEGLGGSWTLTDHDGKTVTDKDVTGTYRLMFFGFTYCPDVCPTELKRLAIVLDMLGDDAQKIRPLFVTVDPERDTPAVLKEYLARFDAGVTGLTGTIPQIEHMEKIFKVYSAKTENEEYTEYMVNHSALLYFIGPDDNVIHLFHSKNTPEDMANFIRETLRGDSVKSE